MTDSILTPDKLAARLDHAVKTLRNLLIAAERMHDANRLGEAARIPDELARGIACVASARNAATHEAFHSVIEGI